jgi:hypothetical protein
MANKCCTKCFLDKPLDQFVKSKTTKSGYRGLCKECFNAYYAKRRVEKYDQVRAYEKKFHYERRLKYEYNITKEEIESLRRQQDNKCAICRSEVKLVIDHNHNTGKVRGLLCNNCNTGLGQFKDNSFLLMKAYDYLELMNGS